MTFEKSSGDVVLWSFEVIKRRIVIVRISMFVLPGL